MTTESRTLGPSSGIALLAVFAAILAAPASAQTLTINVVDAASSAPVTAAMVTVLAGGDSLIAGGFTRESGSYVFRNTDRRPVSIVARHIGFSPARIRLDRAVDTSRVITLSLNRLTMLAAVVTNEQSECEDLSGAGAEITQIWENIRSALEATRFAQDQGLVRIEIERYEQDWDGRLASASPRRISLREVRTGEPFAAASSANLASKGYVVGTSDSAIYFAPDARTLLSSDFTSTHCFSIRRPKRGDDPELIGLAFQPRLNSSRADVSGTLWVHRNSGALDRLLFNYVNVESSVPTKGVGGRLDFRQLAGGEWIITHWHILTPRLGRFQRVQSYGHEAADTLLGFRETGGNARALSVNETVIAVDASREPANPTRAQRIDTPAYPECEAAQQRETRTLRGSIRDSAGLPVTNSKLSIEWLSVGLKSGAGKSVTAAARGQKIEVEPGENGLYSVCGLPLHTEYRLRLTGDSRKPQEKIVQAGATAGIIPLDFVLAPSTVQGPRLFRLTGVVRDDATPAKPIVNASIRVANLTARSDSSGFFVVSGIPAGTQDIEIKQLGFIQIATRLDFSGPDVMKRLFVLSPIRTRLDTVEVRAAAVIGKLQGFEDRRLHGFGSYITREQFEKGRDRKTSDILQSIPALKIVSLGANDGAVARLRGGKGLTDKSKGGDAFDRMRGARAEECYSQIFIDGVRAFAPAPNAPLFNINTLTPNEIEGVEFYRGPSETPAQYETGQGECGTLLVWTRSGGPSKR